MLGKYFRITGEIDSLLDSFSVDFAAGAVIGSNSPSGAARGGTDTESKLSIDHSALRMPTLTTGGWARMGIAYGPYTRTNGLAFVVRFVDGDTQDNGAGGAFPDHIALGWFTAASPATPLTDGNALVIREASTSSGRWRRNGSSLVDVIQSFRQNEAYVLIILRATGCEYWLGSVANAEELVDYPLVRPVGIDTVVTTTPVYPGVWTRSNTNQATRVRDVNVSQVSAWANWYGTAEAADTLIGTGTTSGRAADVGGTWTVRAGTINITATGASANAAGENASTLATSSPMGCIKCTIVTGATVAPTGVMFGYQDASNHFLVQMTNAAVQIQRKIAGTYTAVAQSGAIVLGTNSTYVLQVIWDGNRMRVYVNQAEAIAVNGYADTTYASATGCGIRLFGTSTVVVKDLEFHPRSLTLPAVLQLGRPYETLGATSVVTEDFAGGAADMAGKTTTTGSQTWARTSGTGLISLNGSGKGIFNGAASTTLYTVPWSGLTTFADLAVDVTPDGASYGLAKATRAGVLFYQDASNYLAFRVFVDDGQTNAAEIEIELMIGGVLTIMRRTNWGVIINHGVTTTIRATFDGNNLYNIHTSGGITYASCVYSLTDYGAANGSMAINRVGLYAGNADTGSLYDNFVARSA